MPRDRACRPCALTVGLLFVLAPLACGREPHVRFEPTPDEIVDVMLRLAEVNDNDRVYDLGSGDGRIVIAAARQYGAHGVGFEIDAGLIKRAQRNARAAGVEDKVRFIQQDLFEADIRRATVVTLYLLPEVNVKLRPKLLRELAPGTRIVSHNHDMGEWPPEQTQRVRDFVGRYHRVHLWIVPSRTDLPATVIANLVADR